LNERETAPGVLITAAALFQLVSVPARLHTAWILATSESDVPTLAALVGSSPSAVRHHLAELRRAGLVRRRWEPPRYVYALADVALAEAVRLMVGVGGVESSLGGVESSLNCPAGARRIGGGGVVDADGCEARR
jgi:DNA-binding transcriptional ArsR family regulator